MRPLLGLFRLLIRRRRQSGKRQNIFQATRIHQMFFRERVGGRKPRPGPGLHQCPALLLLHSILLRAYADRQEEAQMRGKKSVGARRGEYAKQNAPRPRDEEYMQPASSGFT